MVLPACQDLNPFIFNYLTLTDLSWRAALDTVSQWSDKAAVEDQAELNAAIAIAVHTGDRQSGRLL